ncbi:MAG TPA: EAL domain-containing protein, partial [Ruminiclostridium sp.]|nr:EAL domain-containing protein [Ruminiclostridium sp.]
MKGNANFDDILKNAFVDTYFQPVVSLSDGNIIGYEALSRGPKGTEFHMPTALIAEAKRRNRMNELDLLLRKMALINASKHNLLKPLFINIDPIAIYEGIPASSIVRRSNEFGIPSHRVIVEVSEQNALCSLDRFQ